LNKLCGGTITFDEIWDMYGLVWCDAN
jgi:hypothetical protein